MNNTWPELKYQDLKETLVTVQLWSQIIGKIRLVKTPWLNHSWHVTLYVSARGLTTGSIPYDQGIFQIDFDFIAHQLIITSSTGKQEQIDLVPRTVANFYKEIFEKLAVMGIDVEIYAKPNELEVAIPFEKDDIHFEYDKEQMNLYWQALVKIESVFTRFRARFRGKCSPVHLFWGAFDLAVTRFSGREAPIHPGGAPNMPVKVMQEAYSHEVSSCGFWSGADSFPHPVFYAYCYPTPDDFKTQKIKPEQAFYSNEMGEFILRYEDVRNAADPKEFLLEFLQSTYAAAANTAHWDRHSLECDLTDFEVQ
ncbi:DUF5996 family protein [Mucilaginibacter sabulilitoris]|uniref:DUF5996 family protein n=1 Tax=Mucilaginibacter sabulilitoris TaxID=1173583 RepID=A0ABZ0TLL7_9SPHI|nr:DUF5996 family protein [Mucilaginibacter sabulilitoris]WPU93621.1 DUF5996 family protein [Mucilaginibacter sabulilitoris]